VEEQKMQNPIEFLKTRAAVCAMQRKGRYVTPQLDPLRKTAAKYSSCVIFIILLTAAESEQKEQLPF